MIDRLAILIKKDSVRVTDGSGAPRPPTSPIGCDGVFSPFSSDRVVLMNNNGVFYSNYASGGVGTGFRLQGYINNKAVGFEDIGDGSSNTFAIGEYSGGETTYAGMPVVAQRAGWAVGGRVFRLFDANQNPIANIGPIETYQTKSIIEPINSRSISNAAGANAYAAINNTPLNSSHPGGANMARADGSVSYVPDEVQRNTLKSLCGADDGFIVSF